MLVDQDFDGDAIGGKGWTQVIPHKSSFFVRRQEHPWIAGGRMQRLILWRDRIQGNAFCCIGLDTFDQIIGICLIVIGIERSADHRIAGFHPSRWTSGRCHHSKVRVQVLCLLDQGKHRETVVFDLLEHRVTILLTM